MGDLKGSKDGGTWEEIERKKQNPEYGRFSNQQTLKNLTLLKEWCEKKINELTKNKRKRLHHP